MVRIKRGLDIPLGKHLSPSGPIVDAPPPKRVALLGPDFVGMKPSMLVREGDLLKTGQPLFTCKKRHVVYTSPGTGKVMAIHRGERRIFQAFEIELASREEFHPFASHKKKHPRDYAAEEIETLLLESGQWAAFRTRPYSMNPLPKTRPPAIFVSLMDTAPLAIDPELVLKEKLDLFTEGLGLLSRLSQVHVVQREGGDLVLPSRDNVHFHRFKGPHPAGQVGTHIHFIAPVSQERSVWHIGYQDVIAVGHLFLTGQILVERVISLSGLPQPKIVRTRLGADLRSFQTEHGRMVSGSLLHGRAMASPFTYLGRFHHQVSFLKEGGGKEFLGWQGLGMDKFSLTNTYLGKFKHRFFDFTTRLFGSPRAMVPIGLYERVMPLDILATPLLKALLTKDIELAQKLGALELDEEDLSLCTFISPGKEDFGLYLREVLTTLEKEDQPEDPA